MTTFVLDASAVIRFLDNEAGADRVDEIFQLASKGQVRIVISAVNWGEVIGVLLRRRGSLNGAEIAAEFAQADLEIVSATDTRAARSAQIKLHHKIPYADAFGVELASDSSEHVLVTADFDVKPAEHDIAIEFLSIKPVAAFQ